MRVNKIICPECQASLTSKAGVEVGTNLACPKCKHKFAVAAPEEDEVFDDFEVVDDDEPAPKKSVKPTAKKRPVDDDEDEDRPKTKRRLRDDEEEEDRPKAKKRARDDEDDRPRPKKKKKRRREEEELSAYGKIKGNIWIRASVLGVLLLILGIVAWWKFVKKKDEATSTTVTETTQEEDYSKPITKDQLKKLPKTTPKVEPKSNPKTESKTNPKVEPKTEPKGETKLPGADLERIKGRWDATKFVMNGQEAPEGILPTLGITANDNQFLPHDQGNDVFQYELDASKPVPEIELTDRTNVTHPGIYQFRDADTLEICFALAGPRPANFMAPVGSNRIFVALQRVK